ncbi:MAG: DMT family transporter [Pseudomonadota bacterium]
MNQQHPNAAILALGFAVLAVVFNTGMDTLAKLATGSAATWQIVFLRWAYAVILLLPFVILHKPWRRLLAAPRVHIWRVGLNLIASYCLYYALHELPLSVVLSIFFAEPLFTLVMARIVIGEPVSPSRWLATLAGLGGVLVMTRPTLMLADLQALAVVLALAGAACWGLMHVITKQAGQSESTLSLMFWLAAITALFSAGPAASTWQPLALETHGIMVGVALLGSLYSFFWIVALKIGTAGQIASVAYLTLPLAYLAGYLVFGEVPAPSTILGSLIVMAAVYCATRPSARAKTKTIERVSAERQS